MSDAIQPIVNAARARFVLLTLLLASVPLFALILGALDTGYLLAVAVVLVAAAAFAVHSREGTAATFPLRLIFLLLIVGFFVKAVAILAVLELDADPPIEGMSAELVRDEELLRYGYGIAAIGFVAFTLGSVVALRLMPILKQGWQEASVRDDLRARRLCQMFFAIVLVLCLATAYAQYATGVGVMGRNITLPYRLAGAIVHPRNVVIPYLLLVLAWVADRTGQRRLHLAICVALALHALCQTMLMASRGMLLLLLLPLFVLWVSTSRTSALRQLGIVVLTSVVVLAYPLLSALRVIRAAEPTAAVWEQMGEAHQARAQSSDAPARILFRISGIDNLLVSVQYGEPGFEFEHMARMLFDRERTFNMIYTQDYAGYGPYNEVHGSAPSLIGAFYVLGGTPLVLLGCIAWPLCIAGGIRLGERCCIYSGPPAVAFITVVALTVTLEGTVDDVPRLAPFYVLALILGEFGVRRIAQGPP